MRRTVVLADMKSHINLSTSTMDLCGVENCPGALWCMALSRFICTKFVSLPSGALSPGAFVRATYRFKLCFTAPLFMSSHLLCFFMKLFKRNTAVISHFSLLILHSTKLHQHAAEACCIVRYTYIIICMNPLECKYLLWYNTAVKSIVKFNRYLLVFNTIENMCTIILGVRSREARRFT